MGFQFGTRSLANLSTCHPALQAVARRAIQISVQDFTVTEGYRGPAAQEAAYKAGNSKARWGQSPHNHKPSLALDVVPYPVDWSSTAKFSAIAAAFKAAALESGVVLRWGGDFQSFVDRPHFEIDEPAAGWMVPTSLQPTRARAVATRGDLLALPEADLLARVIWGECRGIDQMEARAIAHVVVNRAKRPGWWGKDVKGVCLAPSQFSCLNSNDPNLPKILRADFSDGDWGTCQREATDAISGASTDPTGGAVAYHATYISKPRDFGSAKPLCTIGKHKFYGVEA